MAWGGKVTPDQTDPAGRLFSGKGQDADQGFLVAQGSAAVAGMTATPAPLATMGRMVSRGAAFESEFSRAPGLVRWGRDSST